MNIFRGKKLWTEKFHTSLIQRKKREKKRHSNTHFFLSRKTSHMLKLLFFSGFNDTLVKDALSTARFPVKSSEFGDTS